MDTGLRVILGRKQASWTDSDIQVAQKAILRPRASSALVQNCRDVLNDQFRTKLRARPEARSKTSLPVVKQQGIGKEKVEMEVVGRLKADKRQRLRGSFDVVKGPTVIKDIVEALTPTVAAVRAAPSFSRRQRNLLRHTTSRAYVLGGSIAGEKSWSPQISLSRRTQPSQLGSSQLLHQGDLSIIYH